MTEHDVKLVLDNRENALHRLLISMYPAEEINYLEVKTLEVGDICLTVNSKPIMLIERKEASDLLNSFFDGRFLEQREKMLITRRKMPQLLLMFLIEGDYEEVVLRFNSMPERRDNPKLQFDIKRIHSALDSLVPNYGINVHKTDNIMLTIDYLGYLVDLYKKSGGLPHLESNANLYNVTKLPKKLSLTPRETYALSLATVRGVSKEMALVIVQHYPSYRLLVVRYRKLKSPASRENMLANLTYGKGRRIGPVTSTRVYHFIWDNAVDK